MSEGVLIALIAAMAAMYAATLPLLISTRKHARQANYQVTNNHEKNLRDENDERHHENVSRLTRLEQLVEAIFDHLGLDHPKPIRRRKP